MLPQDWSVYAPSARAEHNYRRLRQANMVFYAILGLMAILCVWNVIEVASMIRGGATDLALVDSIQGHLSTRLINTLALVALAIFAFKEWKWGDRNFGMVFVLGLLLFLWLVPVMSAEIQPTEEQMRLEVTHSQCAPGGIEGGQILDSSQCELVPMGEGDIWMSASNPMDGDTEMLPPDALQPNLARWNITARGHFTVYFMLPQESGEACENFRFTTSVSARDAIGHDCLQRDGTVYSVHPFTTNSEANIWFTIYQEVQE